MPKLDSRRKASKERIRIRMYNVGFGDCFLVSLPTSDGPKNILIDCGTINQAGEVALDDVIRHILKDISNRGSSANRRVDIIVATHRHKDHVSGFDRSDWDTVDVGEVWMPWTEDPADPEARRVLESQASLAAALDSRIKLRLSAASPGSSEAAHFRQAAGIVSNALSNQKAMARLHTGFAGAPRRRFLYAATSSPLEPVDQDVLPGVSFFVLGPFRTESVIRDMDPPLGKSYFRGETDVATGGTPAPFSAEWRIEPGEYSEHIDFSSPLWSFLKPAESADAVPLPQLSCEDMDAIQKVGHMELPIAVALDKAVNGTSLMFVLRVGRTHLLFSGDAQWGTWDAAMRCPPMRDLLTRTTFLKVGHHGSHNATPVEFVESLLPSGSIGMLSTRSVAWWPNIPREPLVEALQSKGCMIARSDRIQDADSATFQTSKELFVQAEIEIS